MALALSQETTAIEALEDALVQTMRSRISALVGPEVASYLSQLQVANEELHKLGVGKVFREPEYDDPYFGFYGRLTLLRRA